MTKEEIRLANKRLYNLLSAARERCCNSRHSSYKRYKGKWKFASVKEAYDLLKPSWYEACQKYGLENVSIDRKDNRKGYELYNLRMIHFKEQALHRSTTNLYKIIIKEDQKEDIVLHSPSFRFISQMFNLNEQYVRNKVRQNKSFQVLDKTILIEKINE